MSEPDAEPLLRLARELEAADESAAAALAEVADVAREIDTLAVRAGSVAAFLARLPAARETAAAALREAEAERARRRDELERADQELVEAERTRKEERVAAARRAVVRARDSLSNAEKRLERAAEAATDLERREDEARREAPELERRAHRLAERLRGVRRISAGATVDPGPGLANIREWAAAARASLFVVRGALESERERLIREANELGASALGEPVGATSVSLVRRRIEARATASGPP